MKAFLLGLALSSCLQAGPDPLPITDTLDGSALLDGSVKAAVPGSFPGGGAPFPGPPVPGPIFDIGPPFLDIPPIDVPSLSCDIGIWSSVPLAPLGGDINWSHGGPPEEKDWIFRTIVGPSWVTHGGNGLLLFFEWSHNGVPEGKFLAIRKVRIRANSTQKGSFVEVSVRRHDFDGPIIFNMDSGAPRQFDNETTELTVIPDQFFNLTVDPSAVGPTSHSVMVLVKTVGSDLAVYTYIGVDIFWELCEFG